MPETFFQLQPKAHQKMMCQEGQRHMMMPTAPSAGFIMIHPQFAFAFFERSLDRPAQARLAYQISFGNLRRSIAQIIFDLSRITRAAAKDNPHFMARAEATFTYCADKGEVSGDRAFGAFLNGKTFPSLRRQPRTDLANLLRRGFFFRN